MTYRLNKENVEAVTTFQDSKIPHPIHQCKKCGHSISPKFAKTTNECGMCYEGINKIGEYIDRIYAITFYLSEFSGHTITNAIQHGVKEGYYIEEMAEMIEWGIEYFDNLGDADYIVPPPRGTQQAELNHMKKICQCVSTEVDMQCINPLQKRTEYDSQKSVDYEDRIENIKNNIKCTKSFDTNPEVLIIDDIVTSTGTMKYSAKPLINSGAKKVRGLGISRAEKIEELIDAKVILKENDENDAN